MQLGLHGEKKSIENWHNIRNGHSEMTYLTLVNLEILTV